MLLERYGPRLHALAMRLCRHRNDADDLVQDVFLTALRKWHTFRGDSDPGTWLHTIAARACKARHRRKGGVDRRQLSMSELMPWSEETVMEIAASDEGVSDRSQRQEAIARVQEEVTRLPEHLRLPLVLKEVLQMSVQDVAAALGLAENTVKTRLHRARLALRKAMTAHTPSVVAPAPIYDKQICLDLLKAKLEALDRGRAAERVPQAELCARCRAVFRELDLVHEACHQLGQGHLPLELREKMLSMLAENEQRATPTPRRGRRPVAGRPVRR